MKYIIRQAGGFILSWRSQAVVVICSFKDLAADLVRSGFLGSGLTIEEVMEGELRDRLEVARSLGCRQVAIDPDPEAMMEGSGLTLVPLDDYLSQG